MNARLGFLFKKDADEIESFLRAVFSNSTNGPGNNIIKYIPLLLEYGFISEHDNSNKPGKCSLIFTEAINFELTYDCDNYCPHCLQRNIRQGDTAQLSTQDVKTTILQGYIGGVCTTGINFTGGEVLGNRDDLFEILEYTNSLEIPFRLNSNSWWSKEEDLCICDIQFPSAMELVTHLKSVGLKQFAFSFDERYADNPRLGNNLLESIRLCEIAGISYQIIFTGVAPQEIYRRIDMWRRAIGRNLNYLIPVPMEMVDIGGASELSNRVYGRQSNMSPCNNKGFHRPQFLHISPGGEVRTCTYAIGLSNVGDLAQSSFADVINQFPNTKNNEVFSDLNRKKEIYEKLVKPYLSLYKSIIHECTRNIILARTMEIYYGSHADLPPIS